MSNFLGMDTDAVTALSHQLRQKASEIEGIIRALTSQLDGTDWRGQDGNNFRNDWHHTHCAQLNTVVSALQTAADTAARNVQDQLNTSAR